MKTKILLVVAMLLCGVVYAQPTDTPTDTETPTLTHTVTETHTVTDTPTITETAAPTATDTQTDTPTFIPTQTPDVPPTPTARDVVVHFPELGPNVFGPAKAGDPVRVPGGLSVADMTVVEATIGTLINEPTNAMAILIADMLGRRNGVQKTFPDEDNLQVVERIQPDLTVDIGRGSGIVNENPIALSVATETTLMAPTGPEWIALIQINEASEIVVKYDVVTPPLVDADAIPLAEAVIESSGNIVSVTDRRLFL